MALPDAFPEVIRLVPERYAYRERELAACLSIWGTPLEGPFGLATRDVRIVVGLSDSTVTSTAVTASLLCTRVKHVVMRKQELSLLATRGTYLLAR